MAIENQTLLITMIVMQSFTLISQLIQWLRTIVKSSCCCCTTEFSGVAPQQGLGPDAADGVKKKELLELIDTIYGHMDEFKLRKGLSSSTIVPTKPV